MADLLSVELVRAWRWRCLSDRSVIRRLDLLVAASPPTTRLADWQSRKVDRRNLRCACGGEVIPLAPIRDK